LTAVMESTLLELSASHEVCTASVVNDFWRSDSLELDDAADSSADAETEAL
jgi:hypothetical protein